MTIFKNLFINALLSGTTKIKVEWGNAEGPLAIFLSKRLSNLISGELNTKA